MAPNECSRKENFKFRLPKNFPSQSTYLTFLLLLSQEYSAYFLFFFSFFFITIFCFSFFIIFFSFFKVLSLLMLYKYVPLIVQTYLTIHRYIIHHTSKKHLFYCRPNSVLLKSSTYALGQTVLYKMRLRGDQTLQEKIE